MEKDELKIGKVLTGLMKQEKGMTFKKLSEATGVSASTLKSWSSNIEPKSTIQMKRVSDYFGVSITYLLFGEDENMSHNLEQILTEKVFSSWAKITIELPQTSPLTKKFKLNDE